MTKELMIGDLFNSQELDKRFMCYWLYYHVNQLTNYSVKNQMITIEDLINGVTKTFYIGKKVKMHNAYYYECLLNGKVYTHAPTGVLNCKSLVSSGRRYTLLG